MTPPTARRFTLAILPRSGSATSTSPTGARRSPSSPGEVPIFWARGVTPQAATLEAKMDFMITHSPGHMFVTDLKDERLTAL